MGSASNYAFDLYSPFFLSTNSCKKLNKVPKCFLGHFFFFLFIEFTFIFGSGFLVLLVFRDQIVHVGFGFSEFHFIHTLTSVPMQESLTPEHSSELFRDTFEELLDGGGVADESSSHLKTTGRNVTDSSLDIVGDPLNKVRAVLILDVQHLFINFLHGHTASEHSSDSQVSAMARIASGHHVLGIKHLLGQLGDSQGSVLLAATGGQGGESGHEEVQPGEGHHVDGQFSQVSVQLTGEPEASSDTRHGQGNEMVQITIGGGGEF